MYPDFRYLIYGLTGHFPPQWVGLFKTFGALVAVSFLAATWVMIRELKRKESLGLIHPTRDEKKGITVWPHQRISEIVMLAALGGIIGAKLFNAFETWSDFVRDPIGSLLSPSGLTFYGGFIVATAVFYFYARKYKIRFAHLCDAAAPAIMLAYGIGRLGCQSAGDGDWGIYNTAYVTDARDGSLHAVSPADGMAALRFHTSDLQRRGAVPDTDSRYISAPAVWLRPFFAQSYPRNVSKAGVELGNSPHPDYRWVLPVGVFPTPIYEAIAGVALFGIMWGLRRRLKRPWQMFGLFLIFSGAERFLVEQIRVNATYDWGFLQPTQAEIIAVCLILIGGTLYLRAASRRETGGREDSTGVRP